MEELKLVFLGTAASVPTKERNLSAVALKHLGEWLLFDCPEGTQRQMMTAGVSYLKIRYIFISHFHADHFLGLPGMLATMSIHQRDYPITIFGPKGIRQRVGQAIDLSMLKINFEVRCKEVKKGTIVDEEKFLVRAFPLKHEVPCYGYSFREADKLGEFSREKALTLQIPEGPLWGKLQKGEAVKIGLKTFKPEQVMDLSKGRRGRKVSVIFDTRPDKEYFNEIKESDVLVHEATFLQELASRAIQTKHSTAKEAGAVAAQTRCKKLVLTHISARNKEEQKLENEARQEFADVTVAKDLMEIKL
ncbi:MAG: ribonuclease Z [Candidatus Diapherotrites archaeon]|nr:ribonuclease Z [Candidatus Diapherotrites archaeon]